MLFHYYYILQDLLGLLIVFTGLRLAGFCFKLIIARGFSFSAVSLIIQYLFITASGMNLVLSNWSGETWLLSTGLMAIGIGQNYILRKIKYRSNEAC